MVPHASEIAPGIELRDRGVYLRSADTIVVADLHIGRSRTASIELPLDDAERLRERLIDLVRHFNASRLVFAGDLLDAFETLPKGVSSRTQRVLEAVEDLGTEPIVLRGNHDPQLPAVYAGNIRDAVVLGDTVVCHGHRIPDLCGSRYLMGHLHPMIRIEGDTRPVYLFGTEAFQGSDVLILPAFSRLVRGTVINSCAVHEELAPLIGDTSLATYRPAVRDEEGDSTLWFPTLGKLRPHL